MYFSPVASWQLTALSLFSGSCWERTPLKVFTSPWSQWLILPSKILGLVPTQPISHDEGGSRTRVHRFPSSEMSNFCLPVYTDIETLSLDQFKIQIRSCIKHSHVIGYIRYVKFLHSFSWVLPLGRTGICVVLSLTRLYLAVIPLFPLNRKWCEWRFPETLFPNLSLSKATSSTK